VNRIGRREGSQFADSRRFGAWDRGIGRLVRDAGRPGIAELAVCWAPRAPGERGYGAHLHLRRLVSGYPGS
jgi:hypothetical protein